MRNLIATTFVFSLIAASATFAQNTGSSSVTKSATPSASSKPIGTAPVGHRQPTAADVPALKNATDLSAENRALDRKIKGICRGC